MVRHAKEDQETGFVSWSRRKSGKPAVVLAGSRAAQPEHRAQAFLVPGTTTSSNQDCPANPAMTTSPDSQSL